MQKLLHIRPEDVPGRHKKDHDAYEYVRREIVSGDAAQQCVIAVYEVPSGKSAYPYHYHIKNEETFYILSGHGLLKTPDGCRDVSAGDFLFFPANENGAHKLTNSSESEPLIYIDFDSKNDLEVAFYPDSEKVGIWGKGINKTFKTADHKEYYEGE